MNLCLPPMQDWGSLFAAMPAAARITFSVDVAAYGVLQPDLARAMASWCRPHSPERFARCRHFRHCCWGDRTDATGCWTAERLSHGLGTPRRCNAEYLPRGCGTPQRCNAEYLPRGCGSPRRCNAEYLPHGCDTPQRCNAACAFEDGLGPRPFHHPEAARAGPSTPRGVRVALTFG
jgi:hypothetical protein